MCPGKLTLGCPPGQPAAQKHKCHIQHNSDRKGMYVVPEVTHQMWPGMSTPGCPPGPPAMHKQKCGVSTTTAVQQACLSRLCQRMFQACTTSSNGHTVQPIETCRQKSERH
jgi:hypothetical protein